MVTLRGAAALCACVLLGATSAEAVPRRARRAPRDRFGSTLLVGFSNGVGTPRGVLGTFVEFRPWAAVGVAVGAGLGGTFGGSVDGTLLVSPFGGRAWRFDLTASYSRNYSYVRLALPGGPSLPMQSDWVSAGAAVEFRNQRGVMLRLNGGRTFLRDTSAYGVLGPSEVSAMQNYVPHIPGSNPVDAVSSALRGEDFAVWYASVEVGFSFSL
ncbi:MAG: hypothetical protein JWM10_4753 [Myxococcaceae bacterium]|nr:hypothetical protein [Myxococcaceae bacterium]